MSDTIPPLYSSSPPPLTKSNFNEEGDSEDEEDDDDDEYGKFEEFSTNYNHSYEDLFKSPQKLFKFEPQVRRNPSELIAADCSDLTNSTRETNQSSIPLDIDTLHSKTSDKSIDPKLNTDIIENNILDSAISRTDSNSSFNVEKNNFNCNNFTSNSHPIHSVVQGNHNPLSHSIKHDPESILESVQRIGDNFDAVNSDKNVDLQSSSTEEKIFMVESSLKSLHVLSNEVSSSPLAPTVSSDLNDDDDDFDFKEFQSCSEQISLGTNETRIDSFEQNSIATNLKHFQNESENLSEVIETNAQIDTSTFNLHSDSFVTSNDNCPFISNTSDSNSALSTLTKPQTLGNDTIENFQNSPRSILNVESINDSIIEKSEEFCDFKSSIVGNELQPLELNINGTITKTNSVHSLEPTLNSNFVLQSIQVTEDIINIGKEIDTNKFSLERREYDCSDPFNDGNFGDFETSTVPYQSTLEQKNAESHSTQQEFLSDDDFSNFESAYPLNSNVSSNSNVTKVNESDLSVPSCPSFDADFDQFQSSSMHGNEISSSKCTNVNEEISSSSSMGKVGNTDSKVSTSTVFQSSSLDVRDDEDDFDNFTEFNQFESSAAAKENDQLHLSLLTESPFWTEMFSVEEGVREIDVVSISDLVVASGTWSKLREIESSPTLSYEWSKSVTYNKLLTMLNIDVQNTFGLNLRSNVPRFAANLSTAPLEPSKADKESISSSKSMSENQMDSPLSNFPDPVPAAHFDWISSGLVNPLDYVKKGQNSNSTAPKPKPEEEAIDKEVREFLQSLPDLSFMRVSHVQFPINPANPIV